jgi:guanine deaminase
MHESFMQEAIRLAVDSVARGGGPFGCVIVRDGQVIARGSNAVTSSFDPTAHAEVVAIREACRQLGHYQLAGCELYTSCEPCPMCFGAIYWARPKAVYFAATRHDAAAVGFDDEFIYEELAVAADKRKRVFVRLAPPETLQPFQAWQAKADKTEY